MKPQLDPLEARLIGCLIEKQITTPDQYPLSLNALTLACNQKSNRDPVMSVDDATVQATLDRLSKKHLVIEKSGFGSRVPKYQHRFCNTEFGTLKFTPQELAIVCELLLRGPQMPGELRSRASRMASFADVSEVESALQQLSTREDGPFVVRLAREPGRRESRYVQLFTGEVASPAGHEEQDGQSTSQVIGIVRPATAASAHAPDGLPDDGHSRLDRLERQLRELRAELDSLKSQLGV